MYGTVARLRVKSGVEAQFADELRDIESARIPGAIASYLYRMDDDPRECYLTVLFESKDAYVRNAESPEQDARYRKMLALLEREPEWHDGEVIFAGQYAPTAASPA
jgi:heme-degrading monooxygenase HmoA